MTIGVVQCLICKTIQGTWQTGGQREDKNWNFCHSLKHYTI